MCPPHYRKELLAILISGRDVMNYETEFYKKDGNMIWALVSLHPTFDEDGNLLYIDGIMQDITKRKRMEEELRKAHKLESLGVLAGGIAHDFNNLLSGILGNLSLAKTVMDPDSKSFKRLDEAENAVYRARDLTQQLMTFSKGGAPIKKNRIHRTDCKGFGIICTAWFQCQVYVRASGRYLACGG